MCIVPYNPSAGSCAGHAIPAMRLSLLRNFLLLACLGIMPLVQAQNGRLAKADRYFERYAFADAAPLYERALAKKDLTEREWVQPTLRLAECYRLTNQFEAAADWYGKVVGQKGVNPEYRFRYGQMLLSTGRCEEAQYWFRQFSQQRPKDSRGPRFEAACEELSGLYADNGRYTLELLECNTEYADFGPAFYGEGLVYLSARPDKRGGSKVHAWTGEPFLDFYFTAKTDAGFRDVEHFGGNVLNSKHHEGPVSFSANGERIFFTSNNAVSQSVKEDRARTVRLKIFTADRKENGEDWGRPRALDFNSGDFSNSAPALSTDGNVLVFSSTRPGGFGGADLYMSRWENDAWTRPVNLGSGVNTEGEEVFPFLHEDGTLYFASDGLAGLGGLDLFAAEADFSDSRDGLVSSRMWTLDPADSARFALGKWLPARNMGWALNSPWDDFGLVWDAERENGYFASNRPGGIGNDDIYFMRHNWVRIEGLVYDSLTGEPLPYSQVRIEGAPAEKWVKTNDAGVFAIDLPKESLLSFEGFADGYASNTVSRVARHGSLNRVEVPLIDAGIPVQVRVVHAVTGQVLPGTALTMDNPCTGFLSEYTADAEGKVTITLSRTCDYMWSGTREGYSDGVLPISLESLRNLKEAAFTMELDPLVAGMTVELKNIYYDYDMDFVREDGVSDLIALAELMQANPEITIEIGSHTDARGSDRYNANLSQRRAESAVAYLIRLGVDPGRLSAQGYGEMGVRNRCVDGVDCNDDEHQYNRRTEFTVTGVEYNLRSSDKENIPVNTGRRAR